MVLKEVNWVHIDKIRSNGLERGQLGTQSKNHAICYWEQSIGYTMIKLGHMVLKGVNWIHNAKSGHMVLKGVNWLHNDKIRLNCLERSN